MSELPGLPVRHGGRPLRRGRGAPPPTADQRLLDLSFINAGFFVQSGTAVYKELTGGQRVIAPRIINSTNPTGSIYPMVTVEEDHEDDLVITEHPVEYGAAITDHSYKRPSEVRMRVGWSESGGVSFGGYSQAVSDIKKIYEDILSLQNSRNPFTLVTGKKTYTNMLVAGIRVHTDARFEYSFIADISFKQILLVSTQTITKVTNPEDKTITPTQEKGTGAVTPSTTTGDKLDQNGVNPPGENPQVSWETGAGF